ncbi:sulfotransferase 1C2 [Amia ocellicauda]|uniref:sulfotransferase 1C2 n=1 Tax=Amia ocellicauda TaxID=2972642 RepID=UPI003464599D|nr:ST1C4 Sulfotransferase [Amia calva]
MSQPAPEVGSPEPVGEESEFGGREEIVLWEGLPLMPSVVRCWDGIQNFAARPDDILIATYPKAGTTWVVEMVDAVLAEGDMSRCLRIPTFNRAPFLELNPLPPFPSGLQLLQSMPSPRLVKTHFPVHLVPQSFWDNDCKVVYVARNGKDNMVSYFHFQRMNQKLPEPGTWDEYFTASLNGQVSWGSWFDHVTGWWKAKEKRNILYLFYEDMKEDPAREITRLAKFLGKGLDQAVIDRIVDHTSFSSMKDNPMTNYTVLPSFVFNHSVSPFMRKGEVGSWKTQFTVSQNERFDEEYRRRMTDPSLIFRTEL